jgi:hypothetical protein
LAFQLFDLTRKSALKVSKIERTTLDVRQLQAGFYVVQFEIKAQRFFRKIVVQ